LLENFFSYNFFFFFFFFQVKSSSLYSFILAKTHRLPTARTKKQISIAAPTKTTYVYLEVDLLGGSHGGLNVDAVDVLPVLLQQGSEEVNGELDIDSDLLLGHLDVSDGDVEAHDLLHLELDGLLDLVHLSLHVLVSAEEGGELSGLGEARTEKTGDLLDETLGGHEIVVLLGELLDELLVLVELLQVLDTHVINANAVGLLAVGSVSKHAELEVGPGGSGQLEGPVETLITLGIVVLQADLGLDGLDKIPLLSLKVLTALGDGLATGEGKDVLDSLLQDLSVQLGSHCLLGCS